MAQNRDLTGNVTFDSSPGGLFDTGGDNAAAAAANEAGGDSRDFALDSKGWAIGNSTGSTKGYTPTNNSKYYSEVADSEATAAAASAAAAAGSASAAAGSATAAAASAMEADSDARAAAAAIARVDSDARAAIAAAARADSDARAAAAVVARVDSDASAADTDARNAATSATNAAESARQAMGWAIDTENGTDPWSLNARGSSLRWAKESAASALQAREDRQDIILLRNQIEQDSEEIAGQIAAATAYLNGLESRVDTDVQVARDAAADAASDATEAERQAVLSQRHSYISQTWAVGPGGDTDSEGTSTNNARYWAQQAMNARLDTDLSDSEITLTAGTGLNGGGNFTLNQHQNETITFNLDSDNITNASRAGDTITLTKADGTTIEFTIGGGGGSGQEPDLKIDLSPDEVELAGSGTQAVSATFSASGFTLSDVTFTVRDPDNNNVPVTGTGNSRSVTVSRTTARSVRMTVGATLTRTSDNMVFTGQTASADFVVAPGWYRDIGAQPGLITDMDNQGVWDNRNPNTQTITAEGGNRGLYYALPTRSGGYRFHSGFVVYNNTNLGAISSDWTLYRIDDFDDSQNGTTFTITVEEA